MIAFVPIFIGFSDGPVWRSKLFKNIVAANSLLFKGGIQQGRWVGKYLYSGIALFIVRSAGLGSGRPEVKPSTSGPLPARLKELAGKLGWMKWEPPPLEDAPHFSEGRRSRQRGRGVRADAMLFRLEPPARPYPSRCPLTFLHLPWGPLR